MKKRAKKCLSGILVFVMLLSILTVTRSSISAAEVDNESVSANAIKTRDEAVAWLNSQNRATYDFNGANGTQCVEFIKAYVNWLMTGNPWQDVWNRPTLNGNTIWQNSLWGELGWAVHYNTADFMPQPGDIFSAGTNNGNHTGIVISSDLNTAVIADANARDSEWSNGDPVLIHTINWRSAGSDSAYGATHYIRPNFNPGGHNPEGVVDIIEGGKGTIHVRGWAFDRDDFANQIPIHVYIGGRAGDANAEGHAITANVQRSDVNAVYGCGDWHGFDAEITTSKRGNQPVYIYACNIGAGSDNPQIGEGTANIAEAVDPIDVSSVFYAKLAHAGSGKCITQENPNGERYSNVALYQDDEKEDNTSYQLWKFERQSDLSYIITNVKTGHCLDDYNAAGSNGNNVIAHEKNGSDAQRWFFVYGNGSSFSLVPKCAQGFALDLNGNFTSEGTNIQIYQRHQMAAQLFDIIQMDYFLGETEYNGNKYQLFNCPVSWKLAKELCEDKGGHLVTITSKEEENKVNDLRSVNSNPYVWIGATDESGSWKWVTGEKFNYSNWDSGQPDNYQGKEHYACIWGSSKWNDYDNDASSYVNCYICEFEKQEAESVTLNKTTLTIETGKVETLTATISPSNAYDKSITWTSSNINVATVSNGTITAKATGTATITAKTTNGKTATCTVTVKATEVAITGIVLNQSSLTLEVDKSETLIAELTPTNATNKAITWTSSNSEVATVANGKVTAKSVGETTITAKTTNGKTATCKVVVKNNADPNAPKIILDSKTVNAGSRMDVSISIKNNPGIVGMTLRIKYDESTFKLVNVTDGDILGANSHKPEFMSPYTLSWSNDTATTNITQNGNIATLTFEVADDAKKGQYQIEAIYDYDNVDIYNKDLESVKFDISGGNVSVADYLCGDVNSDGRVNNLDRVYITRYLANWNDYKNINLNAADVNADGKVNNLDKVILTRHLANWNDYASLPYKN